MDSSPTPLGVDPAAIANAEFAKSRKGFDRIQVRAYLTVLSREFERLVSSERDLKLELERAAEQTPEPPSLDSEQLTKLLGDEAARVLSAARESASERLAAAEAAAEATLHQADAVAMARRDEAAADAARIRADADHYARETRRAADADAAKRLADTEDECRAVLDNAAATGRAEIEEARLRGEQLIADAERVRERVLRDFSRRRKQLRVQVEQLRAAHDRLLEAHRTVRRALDGVETELDGALPAARAAAEAAGQAAAAEPEPSIEQLAAEIEIARLVELPVVADEVAPTTGELEVSAVEWALGDTEPELEPEVAVEAEVAVEPAVEPEPVIDLREVEVPAGDDADEPAGDVVDDLFARIRDAQTTPPTRPEPRRTHADRDLPPLGEPVAAAGRVAVVAPPADLESSEPVERAPVVADEALALVARRDAVLDVFEVELTRLLKRCVSDEQNEVQDAIRRARGKAGVSDVLPPRHQHITRFVSVIESQLVAVAKAATAFFDSHTTPHDHRDVAERVLAVSLVDPLRTQIERVFAETSSDDERIERVRSAYREAKSPRADLVARELTVALFSAATLDVVPAQAPLRWIIDAERGCSPDCFDNSLATGVRNGEAFPTGAFCPPTHQRCRCMVAPADH